MREQEHESTFDQTVHVVREFLADDSVAPDEAIAGCLPELERRLRGALGGGERFIDGAHALFSFAEHIHRDRPESTVVIGLVHMAERLLRTAAGLSDDVQHAREPSKMLAESYTGHRATRVAPRVGAPAPEGTKRVSAMMPPTKMR